MSEESKPTVLYAAPHGWKLVPVEPTKEMVEAWGGNGFEASAYRAMLAAAPQPNLPAILPASPSEEGQPTDVERIRAFLGNVEPRPMY